MCICWVIHPLSSVQDVLEFRVKIRPLRVKTVDGTVKTVLVGDYIDGCHIHNPK